METAPTTSIRNHAIWSEWISDAYITGRAIDELREWFRARPRSPILLANFLRPERASTLRQALLRLPLWQRVHSVVESETTTLELPIEEWFRRPVEERWNSQDIARPLDAVVDPDGPLLAEDRIAFQSFFLFAVIENTFRRWMAEIVGVELQQLISCEIVRYQQGDFITTHSDTHDSRIVGVNFYLGNEWEEGDGGILGYENEDGEVFTMAPRFNSISIIPIAEGCQHWVTPWTRTSPGRHTISISFRPEIDKV